MDVVGTEAEAVSSSPASPGSHFRSGATSGQYIYNWGTRGLTTGSYPLRIDPGDGVAHTIRVSLR
jgi:hypothetical protein